MKEYHKIKTVFERDPTTKYKTLIHGKFALPEFEYLEDNHWIWTEKVDGMNIRVMWNGESISLGGKTDRAQIPAHLVNRLNELFLPLVGDFQEIFDTPDEVGVCLYGEGYGAKIQKGGGNYKSDGQDFVLFDVKVGSWWLRRMDVADIARNLGLAQVPVIGAGTLGEMVRMAQNGFKSTWGDFVAEGLVARPAVELKARNGSRIITKIKCKDFG